ncbi:hypothetical protein QBC35DRAFT_499988 [Podospora australis]|uniref:Ubiquitin carrier protein n=1 Tax=Podospora australis TaxID=1536484 RepID=A0AAN6WSS8_9PEZI|nr:hypothetical protein QBC35DRAFT_499988 [Podospora australis]
MYSHLAPAVGGALVKRWVEYSEVGDVDDKQPIKMPEMSTGQVILGFLNLVWIIPMTVYIFYTLGRIYPTLAMVEDPLPDYDSIPIADPSDDDNINKAPNSANPLATKTKPLTSSLRETRRLLSSVAGWRSHFRGLGAAVFLAFLNLLIIGPLTFLVGPFAHLIALLILTPFSTALTHVIITKPSELSFFKRVPSFRRAFAATWAPILVFWGASQASILLPQLIAYLAVIKHKDENWTAKDGAKLVPVGFLALAIQLFVVFPAYVALTRIQGSLLPHDDETIVPFDRTFGGRVGSEIVTGKGFATLRDAVATVSKSSWIRLYLQQVKIMAVVFGMTFLAIIFMGIQSAIVA